MKPSSILSLFLLAPLSTTLMAQPVVRIHPPSQGSQTTSLSWSTNPGQRYALWSSPNLSHPTGAQLVATDPFLAPADSLDFTTPLNQPALFFWVEEDPTVRSAYDPAWADAAPREILTLHYDSTKSATQNGATLYATLQALQPGQQLELGSGTYSINSYTTVDLQGTPESPIWIVAAPQATVIITRPNAAQNILNVGVNQPTRYVCFRGLEFVGGSHGLRLYDCTQVWIDRCRIHHTGDVGLSANARNTSHLHLTRNEISYTGGTGEGMYLGGNHASVIMSQSVIALNHVHHTNQGVTQGDGIEVKQGSWGNWIAQNLIHHCHYPCLLVYGTAGQPINIVERNVCYQSNDNTIQVQGDALIRNNLAIAGAGSAFASQPHQANPTRLTVVHNTFINSGTAARLSSWDSGTDCTFANNACYSRNGSALLALNSSANTRFTGNTCYGTVSAGLGNHGTGTGLHDFVDVTWDAARLNARPSSDSPLLGAADASLAPESDLLGHPRSAPHTVGCYQH